MKANGLKGLLRLWLGAVSVAAFVGGWLLLGHSGKPVDAAGASAVEPQMTPLPTLAPLSSNNNRSGSAMQPFIQQPAQQSAPQLARPMFRSRGS